MTGIMPAHPADNGTLWTAGSGCRRRDHRDSHYARANATGVGRAVMSVAFQDVLINMHNTFGHRPFHQAILSTSISQSATRMGYFDQCNRIIQTISWVRFTLYYKFLPTEEIWFIIGLQRRHKL
jgi:hypothetical protein